MCVRAGAKPDCVHRQTGAGRWLQEPEPSFTGTKRTGQSCQSKNTTIFFFSFQCKVLTLYGVVEVFLPMIMAKRRKMCCSAPMRCSWPVDVEVMAAPISHHDPMAASSSIPLLPSEMGHCLPNPCRGSQLMTKIYLALLKNI